MPGLQRHRSASPEETQALGRGLAPELVQGSVLLLYGELGSGKTCFCQGLAQGLGVDPARVTSPTFTLVHEHRGGRLPFFHADLYRLSAPGACEGLGLEEIFEAGVCAVEWPERLGPLAPPKAWRVEFTASGPGERVIEVRRP
jgi:tRNA threonylcarbamoyladenosine biosynthesis protein TsaE